MISVIGEGPITSGTPFMRHRPVKLGDDIFLHTKETGSQRYLITGGEPEDWIATYHPVTGPTHD